MTWNIFGKFISPQIFGDLQELIYALPDPRPYQSAAAVVVILEQSSHFLVIKNRWNNSEVLLDKMRSKEYLLIENHSQWITCANEPYDPKNSVIVLPQQFFTLSRRGNIAFNEIIEDIKHFEERIS